MTQNERSEHKCDERCADFVYSESALAPGYDDARALKKFKKQIKASLSGPLKLTELKNANLVRMTYNLESIHQTGSSRYQRQAIINNNKDNENDDEDDSEDEEEEEDEGELATEDYIKWQNDVRLEKEQLNARMEEEASLLLMGQFE